MQLEPPQTEITDGALELGDRGLTFERVDRREPDERIGMIVCATGHEVVRNRRKARVRLGVPGEQHAEHIGGAKDIGHLLHIVTGKHRAEVGLARRAEVAHRVVDVLGSRRVNVNVDRARHPGYGFCVIDRCGR